MPNIKSAKKRVKVNSVKALNNQMAKSELKTTLKKFDAAIAGGDKAEATAAYTTAVKAVDQAAEMCIRDRVISGLIADEIAIGVVNTKTTAVRVIPAIGKGVGDMVEFGGLLGSAPIMPIKTGSPAKFINRGGRIPAPIQSLKN